MDIRVLIGDYKVASGENTIITHGLGPCMGVTFYDKRKRIGGLAHIMLPYSTEFSKQQNELKFADICLVKMLEEMERNGCKKCDIEAKIAGGANMFNIEGETMGDRNAKAVKSILKELSIPIIAEDIGGTVGRTLSIDVLTGEVYLRKINSTKKILK